MARFRLSGPSQQDLADILAMSIERWGEEGRSRYARLLAAAMRAIAAQPMGRATKARPDLLPGLRSYHVRHARKGLRVRTPVHVIFYRAVSPDMVEIVRVLHERMDPTRHLELAKRSRPTRGPGK